MLAEPGDAVDLPDGTASFATHVHEHPSSRTTRAAHLPRAADLDLLRLREFRRITATARRRHHCASGLELRPVRVPRGFPRAANRRIS
jgi:hypothetical protein